MLTKACIALLCLALVSLNVFMIMMIIDEHRDRKEFQEMLKKIRRN